MAWVTMGNRAICVIFNLQQEKGYVDVLFLLSKAEGPCRELQPHVPHAKPGALYSWYLHATQRLKYHPHFTVKETEGQRK